MNQLTLLKGHFIDTKTREVAGIKLIEGDEKAKKPDRYKYFQQKPRGPMRTAIFLNYGQAEALLKKFLAIHPTTFIKDEQMPGGG